jgi:hypothetical protein
VAVLRAVVDVPCAVVAVLRAVVDVPGAVVDDQERARVVVRRFRRPPEEQGERRRLAHEQRRRRAGREVGHDVRGAVAERGQDTGCHDQRHAGVAG